MELNLNFYKEIEGDLIDLAKKGYFDVIVHGCNCFCNMGVGIAFSMKNEFNCDNFPREHSLFKGDYDKLGCIDYEHFYIDNKKIIVVNAYTQFYPGKNSPNSNIPLDYYALTLCLRKINFKFKGNHIGLPKIGAGLAGGDWNIIKDIIKNELKDCKITIVKYKDYGI